jgi:hypothetical protein
MVLNSWRKDTNWELWSVSVGGVDGDTIWAYVGVGWANGF